MGDALPTESDFVVHGDLDEQAACRNMLGKSREAVRALLKDNFLYYQEDFMFMGPAAFCFYVDAMIGHVTEAYDDDESRQFHAVCEFRLDTRTPERLQPCAQAVADCLDWIARQTARRHAKSAERVERTRDAYRRLAETKPD